MQIKLTVLDTFMMTVAFAEAGEAETARLIMDSRDRKQSRDENVIERRPEMRP